MKTLLLAIIAGILLNYFYDLSWFWMIAIYCALLFLKWLFLAALVVLAVIKERRG